MNIFLIILAIAVVLGLAAFITTKGDWKEKSTEGLGTAMGTGFGCLYALFQLAILAGIGWLAFQYLKWVFE